MADYGEYGQFSVTAVGTNAGVTATQTAPAAGRSLYGTAIQASGDAAALVTVESPSGTVLYRKRYAAAFTLSEVFYPPLAGASGQAMLFKISASTSNSEVNGQGMTVRR